ncbi:tRNA pseudouridine(55) synthase TruB [Aurantivibrio plasticivorans]
MVRKPKGRPISGVLLLNKSAGMTSNGALQRAKRLFFAAKAGHTGSLDPLATGVLPICFGESTKFSQFLLDSDKAYRSRICLGIRTTTSDADGEIIEERDASTLSRDVVEQALRHFEGKIEQIPSMYSALKHQGQPLYKLAREGKEVERKVRQVTVYAIKLLDFIPGNPAYVDIDVECSKGTYIRSIAEDLGQDLGCGGHVAELHRRATGAFDDTNAVSLDELEQERGDGLAELLDHHLLPVDAPIAELPVLTLNEHSVYYFKHGQAVMDPQVYQITEEGGIVRVFSDTGDFLGVAEATDDGRIAPKRLVV